MEKNRRAGAGMKQEEKFVFDWRERQMSLEYLVFLLVAGIMMAASLILLGFTDRKLAPGGGLLLTVLVLLDLYAFDRFRKARITYEWTPAAVRLHGKWLEREIAFREGVCVSGMKLRLPSRFHYWRRESFLVLWKPGERTVDPETLPIFLLARKGGRAAAGHAGAAGQNCGKRWGRTCRNFRRSVRPGRSNKRKNGESGAGSGPDFLNIAAGRGVLWKRVPVRRFLCPLVKNFIAVTEKSCYTVTNHTPGGVDDGTNGFLRDSFHFLPDDSGKISGAYGLPHLLPHWGTLSGHGLSQGRRGAFDSAGSGSQGGLAGAYPGGRDQCAGPGRRACRADNLPERLPGRHEAGQ